MRPNLDILPPEQKLLWPSLSETPNHFVLYGGTAIALRLGHRVSIDFDFFSHSDFEPDKLYSEITYLNKSKVIQKAPNTLTCLINNVKVSFFGGLNLGQISVPEHVSENKIKIASLIDLFGMKCSTVCVRIEKKDYLDIHALIYLGKLKLPEGLAAAKAIYGDQYHPMMTLKALSWFEGGDLGELEKSVKADILNAVHDVRLDHLPKLSINGQIGANR